MKKIKKTNKVSINALLLLIDIPLLFLLSNNLYSDIINLYISIRLIMVYFINLIVIFKLIKTTITIVMKSKLLTSFLSIILLEKNFSEIERLDKDIISIFMFYIECFVLISLFTYSIGNCTKILVSSNNLAIFLTVISLNFILVLIRIYINKRCDSFINLFHKKENSTV